MWGPRARDVLQAATEDDVSAAAFPFAQRPISLGVARRRVWAQRITYVGELGYELYAEPAWGVQVWDRLAAAGARYGLRPIGYRVLDSLRMEKGYRAFGSDLTAGDTPDEAGLGFCVGARAQGRVRRARGGRAAAGAGLERRLRTLLVGDGRQELVYGGEAVLAGETVVGRVRSAAYGYTVGRTIASAYLPLTLDLGAPLAVEALGRQRARNGRGRTSSTTLRTPACVRRYLAWGRALAASSAGEPVISDDESRFLDRARTKAYVVGGRMSRPIPRPRADAPEILPAMLILLPNCECCDRDLPPESDQARICTYECTFCADCAENRFGEHLPELRRRSRPPPDPPAREAAEGSGRDRPVHEGASGVRRLDDRFQPITHLAWTRPCDRPWPSAVRRRGASAPSTSRPPGPVRASRAGSKPGSTACRTGST